MDNFGISDRLCNMDESDLPTNLVLETEGDAFNFDFEDETAAGAIDLVSFQYHNFSPTKTLIIRLVF